MPRCIVMSEEGRVLAFQPDIPDQAACTDWVNWWGNPAAIYWFVVATPEDIPAPGSGDPSTSFPTPEQAAAAWGASFVLVVGCWAIGRAVGAVLNFINH